MNLHCLQHVPFEGPGKIADWAAAHGHAFGHTHLHRGEQPPDPGAVDWLVVMGGPMNVYEYRNHPWLRAEKRFLEQIIGRQKTVLGICLGAQLLADVLGAKVYQNGEKEIGWLPITFPPGPEPRRFFPGISGELTAFHWHGDTFDLPAGAVQLAASTGCPHQAFVADRRLVGLQFHIEVTAAGVDALFQHCRGDLTPGRFVQSPEEILRAEPHERAAHLALTNLLDELERSAR